MSGAKCLQFLRSEAKSKAPIENIIAAEKPSANGLQLRALGQYAVLLGSTKSIGARESFADL